MTDLYKQSIKASVWSSAGEIAAKVISPLVFLVLTRILSPADFGIVAVATTVLAFTNIIVDVGSSKVIIQSQLKNKDFYSLCDAAFWINALIGLILFLLCFLFSGDLAKMNNSPQSANVIKVMSLQIIFNSFSIVQVAIFKKELNFRRLFIIRLVTIGTPAFISIPLAFCGGGYWSIVIGSVAGSLLSCITLWILSKWKPTFRSIINQITNNINKLLSKSIWTTLDQIISYVPIALDTFLISNYLSERDLGLYTSSRTLFSAAISVVLAPLLPVLFSSLSKIYPDKEKFMRLILTAQKIIFTIASAVGVIVFGFREYITDFLFDQKWYGIDNCVGIIFLVMGFEYFYSAVLEGIRASGDFKGLAINTTICTFITAILLLIFIKYGLIVYIVTRTLSLLLWYPGVFIMAKTRLQLSFFDFVINVKKELIGWLLILLFYIVVNNLQWGYWKYFICSGGITIVYLFFIGFNNFSLIKTIITKIMKK